VSDYSKFVAWSARCQDCGGYGMTPGDTMHLGLRDYNAPYPCPNGLPIDTRLPGDCEPWRQKVEKAKRDIERWNREVMVATMAAAITDDECDMWFEAIIKGQNEYCIESEHV